jgi:hypothetical protein
VGDRGLAGPRCFKSPGIRAALDGQDDPAPALVAAGRAYVQFAWDHLRYQLMFAADGYEPDAVASASDDPHVDSWPLWAALHGVATLEKPTRPDYLRLGPFDRPAMLETLIRRIVRLH